jgi:hypothetical protein
MACEANAVQCVGLSNQILRDDVANAAYLADGKTAKLKL